MIRAANAADVPQLVDLWGQCFGDEPQTIRLFLQRLGTAVQGRVAEDHGHIQAMAYLLDARMNTGAKTIPVWYEYALGTAPSERRRGIMRALLAQIRQEAFARKIPYTALVPANAQLAGYYERLGYQPFFTARTVQLSRSRLNALSRSADGQRQTVTVDAADIRNRQLAETPYSLLWNADAVQFALRFAYACGAHTVQVPGGYTVWTEESRTAQITEWMALPGAEPALAAALLRQTDCTDFFIRLPEQSPFLCGEGTVAPFGWLRSTADAAIPKASGAYLGLELN